MRQREEGKKFDGERLEPKQPFTLTLLLCVCVCVFGIEE